jgi:hypothetical protein
VSKEFLKNASFGESSTEIEHIFHDLQTHYFSRENLTRFKEQDKDSQSLRSPFYEDLDDPHNHTMSHRLSIQRTEDNEDTPSAGLSLKKQKTNILSFAKARAQTMKRTEPNTPAGDIPEIPVNSLFGLESPAAAIQLEQQKGLQSQSQDL